MRFLWLSFLCVCFLSPPAVSRELSSKKNPSILVGGSVHTPVAGPVLNKLMQEGFLSYTIQAHTTKAGAPIEGSVYYAGWLAKYGLCVVIKNEHRVAVIGNLDRVYVEKGQYLFQDDPVGTVAYNNPVVFLVQNQDHLFDGVSRRTAAVSYDKGGSARARAEVLKKILTTDRVTRLLQQAGFPEKAIPTMVCIAKWESGLDPTALNFNQNNTVDVGLFQINSSWFKKCRTNLVPLYDEAENSRCALLIYNVQGFDAWTAYLKNKKTGDAEC